MSCGFNPVCYVTEFFAPFWFWIQVGFWIAVALAALAGIAWVNRNFGWKAALGTFVGGLLAVTNFISFRRGRDGKSFIPTLGEGTEHLEPDSPDAKPSIFRPRKPKAPRKPSAPSTNRPGTFNRDEGKWNE